MTPPDDLVDGEITLEGRIVAASNATFVGHIGDVKVVHKPVAGERPLWDFPDGTLAEREVAAYELSEALGWDIVPRTWLREGPFGIAMTQLWRQPDPEQQAVTLVPAEDGPAEGWCHVFDGLDAQDRAVSLVHEDSPALRRMAVFDVIANNADRKGGHVLGMSNGHRHGVDHGLTFHAGHKLRTVLWGWVDRELTIEEADGVRRVRQAVEADLGETLAELLTAPELDALVKRCDDLLEAGRLPLPHGEFPAIPWPPF